jgi:signal transduction histidine kinase
MTEAPFYTELMHQVALLGRKAERERQARKLAENLLEQKSHELYVAKVEAERANRLKSEFLANMSHELRTPLNAIIGFAELIKNESIGPVGRPQYRTYAGDICDSGQQLLALINDILDLAKVEAGHLTLREERLDLSELLRQCLRMVALRANNAQQKVELSIAPDLPLVMGDETRLRQIVLNLLSNAVKFTPAGGRITVSAQVASDGAMTLAVADSGIGIAEADLDRVLLPFVQVDGGLMRRHEGTGLGLPLTKRLVELHGGTLRLDSRVGAGTTATVILPAVRLMWEAA